MAGDAGGAAADGLDAEHGLRRVVQVDDVFGGLEARFEERVVDVREDVDRRAFAILCFVVLERESIRYFFIFLFVVSTLQLRNPASGMHTYISLQCIQQQLQILDARICNWHRDSRSRRAARRLVEELHPDAAQVGGDGLDLLLLTRYGRSFEALPFAGGGKRVAILSVTMKTLGYLILIAVDMWLSRVERLSKFRW